ncbi:unnamed protein product, partial [Cuscuta europaea]
MQVEVVKGDADHVADSEDGEDATRADVIISTVMTEVNWETEQNKVASNFPDLMMSLNE